LTEWTRKEVTCDECDGTGKVTRKEGGPIGMMNPAFIGTFICPMCGGGGKLIEEKRLSDSEKQEQTIQFLKRVFDKLPGPLKSIVTIIIVTISAIIGIIGLIAMAIHG